MEVIDVAKADINIKTIFLKAFIKRGRVSLVGLWCSLIARYLNELVHLDE